MEISVTSVSISITQSVSYSATASASASAASKESPSSRHKELFDKLDTNGDGKIDTLELSALASKKGKGFDAAEFMKKVDANGDGSISESESDAYLTAKENAKRSASPGPVNGNGHGGHHHGGGPRGASKSDEKSTTKVYDKLDTNKDGVVSLEELAAGLDKKQIAVSDEQKKDMFTKIDSNNDGSIDQTEFTAYKKKMEEAAKVSAQSGTGDAPVSGIAQTAGTPAAYVAAYTQQVRITYESVSISINKVV
jgi:Ca2+-binding EF-hand superfamily protein